MSKPKSETFYAGRRVEDSEDMVTRLDEILQARRRPEGVRVNSVVSVALGSTVLAIPLMQQRGMHGHLNKRSSATTLVGHLRKLPEARLPLPAAFYDLVIMRPSPRSKHSVIQFAVGDPGTEAELKREQTWLAGPIQNKGAKQKVNDAQALRAVEISDTVLGEAVAGQRTPGALALHDIMTEVASLSRAGTTLAPVELLQAPPRART